MFNISTFRDTKRDKLFRATSDCTTANAICPSRPSDKAYDHGDDGCKLHFGPPHQHEARNQRSKNSDRPVLDQEPAYRAGQVCSRVTARAFDANQARIVGYGQTLRLVSLSRFVRLWLWGV